MKKREEANHQQRKHGNQKQAYKHKQKWGVNEHTEPKHTHADKTTHTHKQTIKNIANNTKTNQTLREGETQQQKRWKPKIRDRKEDRTNIQNKMQAHTSETKTHTHTRQNTQTHIKRKQHK